MKLVSVYNQERLRQKIFDGPRRFPSPLTHELPGKSQSLRNQRRINIFTDLPPKKIAKALLMESMEETKEQCMSPRTLRFKELQREAQEIVKMVEHLYLEQRRPRWYESGSSDEDPEMQAT